MVIVSESDVSDCFSAVFYLQLEVNKTMETHPEQGEVILQKFGNSSHHYLINGTLLKFGKTLLPEGIYTITTENSPQQSYQLDLSTGSSYYVLGLFDTPKNTYVSRSSYLCSLNCII